MAGAGPKTWFLVGVIYFTYSFSWIWSVYPLNFIGLEPGPQAFLLTFVFLLILVLPFAFWWAGVGWVINKLWSKNGWTPLVAASVFTLGEYFRAFIFGLLMIGSGVTPGPHWTLGNPVYLFSAVPIINSTVSVWGIYGLDFIISFFIIAALCLKFYGKNKSIIILTVVIMAAILFINLTTLFVPSLDRRDKQPVKISIIQTNYTQDPALSTEPEDFQKKLNLLKKATLEKPDYIIFPEGAGFSKNLSLFLNPQQVKNFFLNLSEKETRVIDNIRVETEEGMYSRAVTISSKNGAQDFTDKRVLTPGGEYLPYILKPLLWVSGERSENILKERQFEPGNYQSGSINIIFCSEIFSPGLARQDGGFIATLSSLGLFGGNNQLEAQLVRAAQLRAIENQKSVVLASNGGRSYIINPKGNVEKSTPGRGYEILTGSIMLSGQPTWYTKLGDWPILLMSLALLLVGLFTYRNARKN